MNELTTFNFRDLTVRTQLDDNGEPLFCLADVCNVLEISDPSNTARQIREEFSEGAVLNTDPLETIRVETTGGVQSLVFITEPQLYFVMMRSRSEQARPFRQWVVNDVLPSIRKTGSYSTSRQLPELLSGAEVVLAAAGLTGNQLALALDKAYQYHTGTSALADCGVQLVNPTHSHLFTPTELGAKMGLSAVKFNKLLEARGLQTKVGKQWQPTEAGLRAGATVLDTGKKHSNGTPVTQLKWPENIF